MTNGSVDSTLPLPFGSHVLALGGGLAGMQRDRDASIRTFTFQGSRIPQDVLTQSWEELLTPEYIGPKGLQLKETTRATDTYTATQSLDALYFNLDLSLYNEKFRISAGARKEDNKQEVVTNNLSNPEAPPVVGTIDQTDWLPSAAFTWAYSPSAQFRLAYAESLNRPDFREMSPAPYLDPLLDLITVGNPDLVTAKLKNYDARWEYYFSPSESFSLAGFYKDIANPIEKTLSAGGSGQIITLQNALGATLYGAEVDYYQTLGWIRNHDWLNWLEDINWGFIGPFDWDHFFIAFNFAWIESNVEIDTSLTTQTNADRPLQGQSPWVVNLQFGYSNPDGKTEWTLLFNEFGERISQAGVLGQPDIYEQPIPQLNFVYKRSFAENWLLTLKFKNLLNPNVEYTQGQETTRIFKPGREFSAELKWTF
jgi:TonB-dependent receptor